MPALLSSTTSKVNHINLMTDTIIANSTPDDLRTLLRTLLATTNTTAAFSSIARDYLLQTSRSQAIQQLFSMASSTNPHPTPAFHTLLCRARVLYGCGLGVESINLLTGIVSALIGLQWEEDSEMENALSIVDCDLAAALYNVKDSLGTRFKDQRHSEARKALSGLNEAMMLVAGQVEGWGGDNPFERGQDTLAEFEL